MPIVAHDFSPPITSFQVLDLDSVPFVPYLDPMPVSSTNRVRLAAFALRAEIYHLTPPSNLRATFGTVPPTPPRRVKPSTLLRYLRSVRRAGEQSQLRNLLLRWGFAIDISRFDCPNPRLSEFEFDRD